MDEWLYFNYFLHFNVKPNAGGWFILRKGGGREFSLQKPQDMKLIDRAYVKDLFYRFGKESIEKFARSGHNHDVYCVCFYMALEDGRPLMYFNNLQAWKQTLANQGVRRDRQDQERFKYCVGNFSFVFDDLPEEMETFSAIYYEIATQPGYLELEEDVAVNNELFDDNMIHLCLEVARELEALTGSLDKTEDFMMFYSDHEIEYFYDPEYEIRYQRQLEG